MKKIAAWSMLILSVLLSNQTLAQEVEMADGLRADGKIYVVVAIVLVILIAFFLYLMRLDRRIKKIESER